MTTAEKLQRRGQLVTEMRAIKDKADLEKRSMTAEESAKFDTIADEVDKLKVELDAEQAESGRRSRLAEIERSLTGTTDTGMRPAPAAAAARTGNVVDSPEYRAAFDSYLRGDLDMAGVRHQIEQRVDTLQVGLFIKGGALVTPQVMAEGLIKSVDDVTWMLQLADVQRLTQAESLGLMTLDADPADADWKTELTTGDQADLSLGKRSITPHPLSKRIKVSNTLLRRSAGGAEALANSRLAYKFGITFEKGCLTGNGTRQPLGVFTASADGVPTSRDVSTGNTTTSMTPDGLIEAKYALKQAYWGQANWVFHRDGVKQIRKQKDGNGQYLWQPGLSSDAPDKILDVPVKVSEYAPNTFTTGLYTGIIGAFKVGYVIAIALDMTVQRLVELYAEANQTGFIARMEADGAPVLAEAFARVKLA